MPRRTSEDIRKESRFALLRAVHAHRTVTRATLSAVTGLSVATVNTLVEQFLAEGILHEAGRISSHGGRPTTTFQTAPERGLLVGVDVAETYVRADLFDLSFALLESTTAELSTAAQSIDDVARTVGEAVAGLLGGRDHGEAPVLGAGVSLPGQVDPTSGVDVFAPNWGWRNVDVREALQNALGVPVLIDNPLMALATGELWFGAGRRFDDFVAVNLGTGVGAGIVLGGSLLRGRGNSAGEWGHTTFIWNGRECGCGRRGCIEAYVGVEGIRRTLGKEAPGHYLLSIKHQREFIQNLLRADVAGDTAASATMARTGDYLAAGIGNLINMLNPQHVVVGGWITDYAGGGLRDRVTERIAAESLPGPSRTVSVEIPETTPGVSQGMAVMAFEGFLGGVGLPCSATTFLPTAD